MSRDAGGEALRAEGSEPEEGPPGPITKTIVRTLWKRLFDPSASIYLPRIITDGYPEWGLPSYDPARPGGTSPPFAIDGVPQDVADSACLRPDVPYLPVATARPTLSLANIEFRNLSVMTPASLTFSDSEPTLTAVVSVGSPDQRFTLGPNDKARPNYFFGVPCCEPVDDKTRECSEEHWNADVSGQFTGTTYEAVVALTLRLNVAKDKPLTVSILSLGVDAPPERIDVDFDVQGLPEWAQLMAQIAVNEGVASGALLRAFETFLNSPDVKQNVETLVNNALKRLPDDDGDG